MKFLFILFFIVYIASNSFSQTNVNIDSLTNNMCANIKAEKLDLDSGEVFDFFKWHLKSYISKYNEEKLQEIYSECFFKLQNTCSEFRAILLKSNPNKGDWKEVSEMPKATVSNQACAQFFKKTNFFYLEANGDTTKVVITNNSWTDKFKKGTYSKLSLKLLKFNEFEIAFIKSNEPTRKAATKKGEKFKYTIIEKKNNYYLLLLQSEQINTMYTFKLYF